LHATTIMAVFTGSMVSISTVLPPLLGRGLLLVFRLCPNEV
jgi:hypothetical protein